MTDHDASRSDGALQWAELPDGVRAAAIAVVARLLGDVDSQQLPPGLQHIARFAPAKRAKSGSIPIGKALADDAGFRALIAARLPATFGVGAADPVRRCARAFLARLPRSEAALSEARDAETLVGLRARLHELTVTVDQLTGQLAAAKIAVPQEADTVLHAELDEAREQVEKLRGRLRKQGTELRHMRDEADRRSADADARVAAARTELEQERAHTASWKQKAEEATVAADRAREALHRRDSASTRAQLDADRRIELLLDTLAGAARGLRREWHLTQGGDSPADVITRDYRAVPPTARRPVDAALLLQWMLLPHAHLIVDGYNVTKTGYPELVLAAQRDRLVRSLTAVVARTGVEATVVFDGAGVVAPAASTRDVRVVFSPPGVIADAVIARMAGAEPAGRVVIVVTSDREVAEAVRRSGARVAASKILLDVLGG